MSGDVWVDRVLIMAASGLFAFLVALGVVRVWRMFSGGRAMPPGRRRYR